ncbi:MAG: thioredoxin-disulfide reductase [Bacilli bacterium]|nr:thioredoxin-disulfide reductase [Bacilli bacterium]
MYDIIIVGAGPAGLTAAIYAKRFNKSVLILEETTYGGQIINTLEIENYPGYKNISGFDLMTNMYEHAIELGSNIKIEKVEKITKEKDIFTVKTNNNEYKSLSIIISTGAKSRKLGLPNEEKLIGSGISYCAICDGNFYKNKDVAVIGGGNTALDDATHLADICNKVYLIHRRDTFKGESYLLDSIKNKSNIEIITNTNVIELIEEDNKLKEIIIEKENTKSNILVSGVFVAIGQIPSSDIEITLEKDKQEYYISNDCKTNIEGLFVSGDVRSKKYRQLTTAVSDGTIASLGAIEYIDKIKCDKVTE